jgi:uncharacterized membrane protein YhiD involved in acid resistance
MQGSILFNSVEFISSINVIVCTLTSIFLGVCISLAHSYRNHSTRNFKIALSLLPAMIQVVIMMVNGNIGAGLAVAGAFTLVRFRSATGNARDIVNVFLAVAVGLSTGMHELAFAISFTFIIIIILLAYERFDMWKPHTVARTIKVVALDNDDTLEEVTNLIRNFSKRSRLSQIKYIETTNRVQLAFNADIKEGLDESSLLRQIRAITNNLDCTISDTEYGRERL